MNYFDGEAQQSFQNPQKMQMFSSAFKKFNFAFMKFNFAFIKFNFFIHEIQFFYRIPMRYVLMRYL